MGTPKAVAIVKERKLEVYAEVGVLRGDTTVAVAQVMPDGGTIHLFDYADVVAKVTDRVAAVNPKLNIVAHTNTRKERDSYNWTLLKLLRAESPIQFDYIYLDGAHCYDVDGLAFFLLDKFLKVEGFLELDDYEWTHRVSMDNHKRRMSPEEAQAYEDEHSRQFTVPQLAVPHIKQIVDLLIKPMPNYTEVQPDRIYQKTDVLIPRKQAK